MEYKIHAKDGHAVRKLIRRKSNNPERKLDVHEFVRLGLKLDIIQLRRMEKPGPQKTIV